MTEDSETRGKTNKIKEITMAYELDGSYYNKDKLLVYLQLLQENLNLLRAISVSLVAECPRNKKEFIKLFKRPKQIQVQMTNGETVNKRLVVNKACL